MDKNQSIDWQATGPALAQAFGSTPLDTGVSERHAQEVEDLKARIAQLESRASEDQSTVESIRQDKVASDQRVAELKQENE